MRARIYAYRDRIIATPRYLPHPHPEVIIADIFHLVRVRG